MKLKLEDEGKELDLGTTFREFNNGGVNTMINVHDHINTMIS